MNRTFDIRKEPFSLLNDHGEQIHGEILHPPVRSGLPLIVICHSFMAFKDWGFFPYLGEQLAVRGYTALLFNFSRNGVAPNECRISDFTRFSENTFSHEMGDLTSVLDGIEKSGTLRRDHRPLPVVLFGHSRGGGVAIVQTSRDVRVDGLVTWSAIATFDRWTDHQKRIWRETGYHTLSRNSEHSPLRLGINILRDLELHTNELNILSAAGHITVPWLIVHGKADVTVPYGEALALHNAAPRQSTTLAGLDAVGHLYNAANRAEDDYRTLDSLIEITDFWIRKTFHKEPS
jgi:pimeloyl-ACP methyl ester carboxylesterase